MTFFPINPEESLGVINDRITRFKVKLLGKMYVDQTKVKMNGEYCRQLFEMMKSEFNTQKSLDERDINILRNKEDALLNALKELNQGDQQTIDLVDEFFREVVTVFNELLIHKLEIAKQGIEHFLDEDWAKDFVYLALRQNKLWMIKTLTSLVEHAPNKTKVYDCLTDVFRSSQEAFDLMERCVRNSDFIEYLQIVVMDPNISVEKIEAFFCLFHAIPESHIEVIFKNFIGSGNIKKAFKAISKLIQKDIRWYAHILDYLVIKLKEEEAWAIEFWMDFFSQQRNYQSIQLIFDHFFEKKAYLEEKISRHLLIFIRQSTTVYKNELVNQLYYWRNYLYKQKRSKQEVDTINRMICDVLCLIDECKKVNFLDKDPILDHQVLSVMLERASHLRRIILDPQPIPPPFYSKYTTYFPIAQAVLMGSVSNKSSHFLKELVDWMAEKLSTLKVRTTQIVPVGYNGQNKNVNYLEVDVDPISFWVQDAVHFGSGKGKRGAFLIPNFTWESSSEVMEFLRGKRIETVLPNALIEPKYGYSGGSLNQGVIPSFLCIASKLKRIQEDTVLSISYVEGGNVIFGHFTEGEKAGKSFAIVGQDSIDFNRNQLAKELSLRRIYWKGDRWVEDFKRDVDLKPPPLSDEILKVILARDLGIDPEEVYIIDQPFDFHLDMCMSLLGGRRVMLNDAEKAFEMGLNLFTNDDNKPLTFSQDDAVFIQAKTQAQGRKQYEDLVQAQLEAHGFEVIRVPCVFQNDFQSEPQLHRVNFCNSISMQVGGKKVLFSLGAPPPFENFFINSILPLYQEEVNEVHFLPLHLSKTLLAARGGIRCLTQILEAPLEA